MNTARRCLLATSLLSLLTLFAAPLSAQTAGAQPSAGEPFAAIKDGKVLRAWRLTSRPPEIDGRLDEEPWTLADSMEDFVQWEPDNMAPLSERTVIQIAYDDRHLYVAVRCYDRGAVAAGLGRRDQLPPSDGIGIGFDPRHDHLTGYVFQTNPSGVQGDFRFFDDEGFDGDYDGVWEVRTQINEDGWVAEFRIPFSQMRFDVPPQPETVWGFGARRTILRRGEFGEWTGRPRGERGEVSRWGHLVFGQALSPPRRIEILPYALARREQLAKASGAEHAFAGGVDLRVGIGSSSTLSATINPDFAQVEQDPAVLNLTVFETFFPEKRPFFLEDSRTFAPPFALFQLFHSRRIGRTPDRFAVDAADRVVERPEETTILGAAKLTGKTGDWTYGAMSALTAREYARVESESVDALGNRIVFREDRLIEPLASYNVGRVQRDIMNDSSNIGALATAVVRERHADAFTAGADYGIRWNRRLQDWNGSWVVTKAPGPGGVDTGFGGVTNYVFNRKHGGFNIHFDHFSPNFRVNDVGFHRNRVDRTELDAGVVLTQPDPWKIFRRVFFQMATGQGWNGDQFVFNRFVGTNGSLQFLNFWNVNLFVGRDFRALDDLDTRGGPPIVRPAATNAALLLNSDTRKSWRFSQEISGRSDAEGGWNLRLEPALNLQPSARLQASVSTSYTFGRDIAQWITNRDSNGDGVTDHVYGTLRRDVVDATMRATYAVHRDMTFQLFLQPFVAVGDYTALRRLARPRSFDFEPIMLPFDPDFNRKSLRGNVVLRWEYVRGSTLFFVWNLSTLDRSRPGVFTPFRDLGDAFGADGSHVFMVKASYWLSR